MRAAATRDRRVAYWVARVIGAASLMPRKAVVSSRPVELLLRAPEAITRGRVPLHEKAAGPLGARGPQLNWEDPINRALA